MPRLPWLSLLLALAAMAAIPVLVLAAARVPGLIGLEYSSADVRTTLFSASLPGEHDKVAIVAISDDTIKSFETKSPIDRGFLAELIAAIDAAGPAAIGLDVFFLRKTNEVKDAALQRALVAARAPVVLAVLDERLQAAPEQRAYQAAVVATTGRPAGHITLIPDRDDVQRRIAGQVAGSKFPDSFALLLARTLRPDAPSPTGRIAWLQKVDGGKWYSGIVNVGGTTPFATVAAEDVIDAQRREVAAARLAGKIVLIGATYAYGDRHRTPLNAFGGQAMAGVAIHAQMVAQILDGRSVAELGAGPARLLSLLLACLGGFLGWRFRHREFDFLGWSIAAMVLIGVDAVIFSSLHLVMPFMLSMLSWFAGVTCGHNLGLLYDWEVARSRHRAAGG